MVILMDILNILKDIFKLSSFFTSFFLSSNLINRSLRGNINEENVKKLVNEMGWKEGDRINFEQFISSLDKINLKSLSVDEREHLQVK